VTSAEATVVIPSKDRPVLARRAVTSMLNQIGVGVEIVVVDDGSLKPLAIELADLVEIADGRVTVVRNERSLGVATARNRGLAQVRTGWVGFCDDDDLWAPTKVVEQLAAAERTGAGWTCSAAITVDAELRPRWVMTAPYQEEIVGQLLEINVMPGGASSVIARADLARAVRGFDPSLSTLADWDFWIRLAAAEPLATVERPLTAYLLNEGGMSLDVDLLEHDLARLVQKHEGTSDTFGRELSRQRWLDYVCEIHLRRGRRFRGAWAAVRSTATGAHPRRLGTAALAIVDPERLLRRRENHRRNLSPPEWLAEADTWLAPHRDGISTARKTGLPDGASSWVEAAEE